MCHCGCCSCLPTVVKQQKTDRKDVSPTTSPGAATGATLLKYHQANYGTRGLLPVFARLNKIDKSGLQFYGNSGLHSVYYNEKIILMSL